MAMTDRELVSKVGMIYKRMKAKNPDNERVKILENQLDVFYQRHKMKRPTKSGISINKKMTTEEKKEMRQILRQFRNAPRNTEEKINKEFDKKYAQYLSGISRSTIPSENLSIKQKENVLKIIDRILQDRKFIQSLGSEAIHKLYYEHQKPENLDTEQIRKALTKVASSNIDGKTSDDIVDMVLLEYDKMENKQ